MYGIESELIEQRCILDFTFEMREVFENDMFADMNPDRLGVLCVGPAKPELLQAISNHVPFVMSVGGLALPDYDCVTVDFRRAAREAVRHLIGLGHEHIAFIGGRSNVAQQLEQEDRFIGYREELQAADLPLESDWIGDGGFDLQKSYEAMHAILQSDKRPTAVFVSSDKMAYGAYKAIQANGLSIPNDISVMSFDDIEMSEFVNPGLTTVRVHKEELGRTAVKLLIQRMEGKMPLRLNTMLPTELIVRDSCKKYITLA
jgi:LacI family transcriptional regulator